MPDELKLSVSKTKMFNQCKKQFQYNYILKLPRKEYDYHILGTYCHYVLETFHNEYIQGCLLSYHTTMTDAFKAAWLKYKDKMTPEMKAEAWDIIAGYLKSIAGKKLDTIAVEKKFAVNIADNSESQIILNGAIDRISVDDYDGGSEKILHVADWKTTKNLKYLKNDFIQLQTYAYILYLEDPTITRIRASYILLRHNSELITKEFELDEILEIKDKYLKYAEQIRSETEFAPTTSQLCNYCSFQEHCPEGKSMSRDNSQYGEVAW